jgi:hypothetical protein
VWIAHCLHAEEEQAVFERHRAAVSGLRALAVLAAAVLALALQAFAVLALALQAFAVLVAVAALSIRGMLVKT